MSGSKALIKSLENEKVKVIFGYPGGAIMPTYDELIESNIRHVLVRHEQSAAHMADGYARASGRVGVCMATSGPGSTNLVTGIATAFLDSIPIVAVTGQVARTSIGKDSFQEIDIVGITTPIVKHNYLLRDTKSIPAVVKGAFRIAMSERQGPVLIDVPRDVQTEKVNFDFNTKPDIPEKGAYENFCEEHIKDAIEILKTAERPLIVAGGGAINANACAEILTLAKKLGAPVATSLLGKGCIAEDNPLALGMIGMHGFPYVNRIANEADVIIVVGSRFSDRSTGGKEEYAKKAKIIHIEVDPAEIRKNVDVHLALIGDAKKILKKLLKSIQPRSKKSSEWLKRVNELRNNFQEPWNDDGQSMKPQRLLKELREILPRNAIVTTEVGQNQMWAAVYFKIYYPRTFISSGGLGTMGFGFPAALGAKVAKPNVSVVDISGDGSFLMCEHELATSVEENIPVTVIIMDNRVLGMVAQWQRIIHKRYSQVHLGHTTDFVKLAEAYGAHGLKIDSYDDFRKSVKEALNSDVTTVLDVPISPEEDAKPIVMPKGVINIG